MHSHRSFAHLIQSGDAGIHRLLRYWALGLALYLVSLSMLWSQVWWGIAARRDVTWLSVASITGAVLAYAAIRASARLGLSAAVLNTSQCLYAISCVIAAYALVGPMRGVTLSILVVVLVFGGFSSTRHQMWAMCLFAITALGLTMLWKSQTDARRYPPHEELVHFVLAVTMLVAVAYLAELLSRLRKKLKARTQELTDALARIQDMATRDELTQLFNRRQMTQTLRDESARRERSGEPACIAVIDVDHFKRINDTLGHAAGDAVLRCFAEQALAAVRRSDVLARWGGEEFLLLLPATELDAAKVVLDRMRARVRDSVRIGADSSLQITFSAGLVESAAGESVDAAIDLADQAMYRAKREGRDRIACVSKRRALALAAAN
jgi:diguanylate cyclase